MYITRVYIFECNLGESIGREIFFFLTGHGPLISHSRRYNNELTVNCRFCGIFDETPEHLLLYCSAFDAMEINLDTEIGAIESKCKLIVNRISRL